MVPDDTAYHVKKGIEIDTFEDALLEDDGTTLRFKTYGIYGQENGW